MLKSHKKYFFVFIYLVTFGFLSLINVELASADTINVSHSTSATLQCNQPSSNSANGTCAGFQWGNILPDSDWDDSGNSLNTNPFYNDGLYQAYQMFDADFTQNFFYAGNAGGVGQSQLEIYACFNEAGNTVSPWLDSSARCWLLSNLTITTNPGIMNSYYVDYTDFPIPPEDIFGRYRVFTVVVIPHNALVTWWNNSGTTKARYVSINNFSVNPAPPTNVIAGQQFQISWNTSETINTDVGLFYYDLPAGSTINGGSVSGDGVFNLNQDNGGVNVIIPTAGTYNFTLQARGYGLYALAPTWVPPTLLPKNNTEGYTESIILRTDEYTPVFPNKPNSLTVIVDPVPVVNPDPVGVDLKYNGLNGPVTVTSGTSGTLSWTTTNATFCDASQGPSPWNQYPNPDPKTASGGSESTGPITASATYEIYCENAYGTVYDSVDINVSGAPLPPTVTLTFNGSGSPAPITSGQSGTLEWTISGGGATSCTASGALSGSKNPASGSEGTGSITSTRTYTLDCNGTGGSAG